MAVERGYRAQRQVSARRFALLGLEELRQRTLIGRQLFHPRWIQYGSRVLDSIKEESEPDGRRMLDAIFAASRDEAARHGPAALAAHDFVYDVFTP